MNKAQKKIAGIFCFILSGVLFFGLAGSIPVDSSYLDELFGDVRLYASILLIGAGIIILKGNKHE
jgi:hypothetical protein